MNAHDSSNIYPADIAPLARALEQLAEADRRAAGAGFEPRLARAAGEASRGPALRLAAPGSAASVRSGGWGGRAPMRLAAAVAIVAGGLAAWVAMGPGSASAGGGAGSLEQEVDAWLALAGPDDGLRAEIEAMLLQSADLARGLDAGWLEDELMGESL